MNRLGSRLRLLRGARSLVAFSRALGLSYTFVREMERGNRLPSDDVILLLAERLQVDSGELALLTYCDRAALLAEHLTRRGLDTTAGATVMPTASAVAPAAALPAAAPAAQASPEPVRRTPFL
ncbi:MAG: helix-turn-helix domain-containing protein [Planctomycetes bacterium]|nr:helix-turn-helix domain-containing protein [Planctomycetota bacterium]